MIGHKPGQRLFDRGKIYSRRAVRGNIAAAFGGGAGDEKRFERSERRSGRDTGICNRFRERQTIKEVRECFWRLAFLTLGASLVRGGPCLQAQGASVEAARDLGKAVEIKRQLFPDADKGHQIGVIETLLNSKCNQKSFQFDGCFPGLSFKTGSFREGRAVIIVVSETKFAHRRASGDARGYSQGVKPRKSRSPLEMRTGTRRALQFLIVQPFSMAGEGRNPAHWRQIF